MPLAKPRPTDEDGRPDHRTADQRHGDALAEIIDCAARADDLTVLGGERAVLTATITLAELQQRLHRGARPPVPHQPRPPAQARLRSQGGTRDPRAAR
ncbi:DUF222 domain-containing protein [Qaidamihabitans albus]|uniref:DUF222 domain-containing protein n=1 Tax=Qaidamihabitans albus TaxID=2795733 RepID=UPI003556C209